MNYRNAYNIDDLRQMARKEGFSIKRYKIQVFGTFEKKR